MVSEPAPSEPSSRLRDLRRAKLNTPPPSDFSDFWIRTLAELTAQDAQPTVEGAALSAAPSRATAASHVSFVSLGGQKVHAYFSSPRLGTEGAAREESARRPLLVTSHGYGDEFDPERVRRLSTFGFDVAAFDARGFGRSTGQSRMAPEGYILTGIENETTSILRGAVCDFIQARRAAEQWFGKPSLVAFQGFSFAGGLALMAAGVLGMKGAPPGTDLAAPELVAAGAPTFGDQAARAQICQAGSGREVGVYLEQYPERRSAVLSVLRYFDTVYFAPFVKGHVIFGVGLDDPVVPPMTVYPIKNALPQEPEFFELPCSHTARPEEQEWIRWESAWIRALRRPPTADSQPA